jgi:prepilin-type processing-associated H-X9-DG protein/prepilin-type N-terminal cleavage/methylation domain-containing protein
MQRTDARLPVKVSTQPRAAFSLVEMLVVISVIAALMAILFPALHAARVAGRQTACSSNLRQFGIAFQERAGRNNGRFCSGAFDWRHDGCVTETGWVADLVDEGVPPGMMLCPGNASQVSETYNDLLMWDCSAAGGHVDLAGSPEELAPDGMPIINPCRRIVTTPLKPGSPERVAVVEQHIFQQHFNTNYTASWFLVRWDVVLDDSGNLSSSPPSAPASLKSRTSTRGPVSRVHLDSAHTSSSIVPLLGDGATTGILRHAIAHHRQGAGVVKTFTNGPVAVATMQAPTFAEGTPYAGPSGWWKTWARDTLQDYRGFAPVHGRNCNMLFADGSVRAFTDLNGDGLLNNGFAPTATNGFSDSRIDLPPTNVFGGWRIE